MPDSHSRMAGTRRAGLWTAVAAALSTTVALAAKTWCGSPASAHDLYLRWCYSDIPPLYVVHGLHEGAIPYLDAAVEYPVLTGLQMWFASLFATTPLGFLRVTGMMLVVLAAVAGWLLGREVGLARGMAFALAPTLLVSGAVNWDLAPVALAVGGLIAHRRGRDGWAAVLLALGAAAKLWPALLLGPVVLAAFRRHGPVPALRLAGLAVATWVAVNLPVALLAPDNWLRFFELNRERVPDWDALLTVVLRATDTTMSVPTANLVTAAAAGLLMIGILAVAWVRDDPATWHLAALPLLTGFLLANKVWSPQFSLWLIPLIVWSWPGWGWWTAFAVADVAVTITRFPYLANYVEGGLEGAWPWWPFATSVSVRAVIVAALAVVGWRTAVARARLTAVTDQPTAVPRANTQ